MRLTLVVIKFEGGIRSQMNRHGISFSAAYSPLHRMRSDECFARGRDYNQFCGGKTATHLHELKI